MNFGTSGNIFARLGRAVTGKYTKDDQEKERAPGGGFGSNFFEKLANHAGDLGLRGAKYIPALIAGSYGINGGAAGGEGAADPGTTDLGGFGGGAAGGGGFTSDVAPDITEGFGGAGGGEGFGASSAASQSKMPGSAGGG